MCRPNEESIFTEDFHNQQFSLLEGKGRKPKVEIFLKEVDDAVYLLCKSEGRKAKETAMRNKAEKNKISFPALTKKLTEFNQKYTSDYLKINIHLKKPTLTWSTIDEIQNKVGCIVCVSPAWAYTYG